MKKLFFLFSLLLLLPLQVTAAEKGDISKLDQVIQSGILRVGTTGDYKPFSYNKDGGDFRGFDIEVAKKIAKSLDVKVELVPTTWKTLISDLQSNKFDMGMSGISITLDRQKKAFFSTPVFENGKMPVSLCSQKDKFNSFDKIDHQNTKVVVNPGGTNEKFAKNNLKNAKISLHKDNRTIFDTIISGQNDIMITDKVEALFQAQLHKELCVVNLKQPLTFSELGYLLPKDNDFKQWVDLWLHINTKNGEIEKLADLWLSPSSWK